MDAGGLAALLACWQMVADHLHRARRNRSGELQFFSMDRGRQPLPSGSGHRACKQSMATMTLRLVMQSEKAGAALALHGWLSGPEVEEFVRIVAEAPLPLSIDLANLVGADPSGITALLAQRERGARLANASPYISILLNSSVEEPRAERQHRRSNRGGTNLG
jgi:hypothetical protein